ncbi:MAG: tetratricopeptide repeat protein [Endozoicomonadaceae bacterium]|nr:tetratricopeptide repeat protein [Endozoicomonadaceae bacterium]
MSYDTEEEQLITIKQFWSRHGNKILSVVICLILSFYGFRLWKQHTVNHISEASDLYQQMAELITSKQFGQNVTDEQHASFDHLFSTLEAEYADTSYMEYAYLLKVKQAIVKKDIQQAKTFLEILISKGKIADLRILATIRLARLLVSEGEIGAKSALVALDKIKNNITFNLLYYEVLGDAWFALDDFKQAHAAYKQAVDSADGQDDFHLLKLKLDNTVQVEELTE